MIYGSFCGSISWFPADLTKGKWVFRTFGLNSVSAGLNMGLLGTLPGRKEIHGFFSRLGLFSRVPHDKDGSIL